MAYAFATSASRTARQTVLLSIAGAIMLLLSLVAGHFVFQAMYRSVAERSRTAAEIVGAVLLAEERVSNAAQMAAASSDAGWRQRYAIEVPALAAQIERAARLEAPLVNPRFVAEIRTAFEAVSGIGGRAIERLEAGAVEEARALLRGRDLEIAKQRLSDGAHGLLAATAAGARAELAWYEARVTTFLSIAILLATIGFLGLWRRLDASLITSGRAFAEQEARIRQLVQGDILTGLPNRRAFREELASALSVEEARRPRLAVLFIDLDRFRPINDRHGYLVGDQALVETGRRIRRELTSGQFLARVGGDEFVVMLPLSGREGELEDLAARLISAISKPMTIDQHRLDLGASIGFAVAPDDAVEAGELMRKADVALDSAKAVGYGAVIRYRADMDAVLNERLALEADLRVGLQEGQLIAHFQPLVDLKTRRVKGFEALARWQHPTRGLLPPSVFIPIAEDRGLIDRLTLQIMRHACRAARDWDSSTTVAINVAPELLKDTSLVDRIKRVLAETGFPARRLEIEITENALVEDLDTAKAILRSLREIGIGVALDDFGTGYASLAQLADLEFDKIKIDAAFVRSMSVKRESATIIHAIVGLGRSLGLPTLAEGIESEGDVARLLAIGCEQGQGYFFAKPMLANEVTAMLARDRDHVISAA